VINAAGQFLISGHDVYQGTDIPGTSDGLVAAINALNVGFVATNNPANTGLIARTGPGYVAHGVVGDVDLILNGQDITIHLDELADGSQSFTVFQGFCTAINDADVGVTASYSGGMQLVLRCTTSGDLTIGFDAQGTAATLEDLGLGGLPSGIHTQYTLTYAHDMLFTGTAPSSTTGFNTDGTSDAVIPPAEARPFTHLQVFLRGVLQRQGVNRAYTISGPNQLTFNDPLHEGDDISIFVFS
jgi:hypothetical protein